MRRVEGWLARWATGPVILALALAALVLMQMLGRTGRTDGMALDVRLGYTTAVAQAAIAPLSPAQRDAAARAHLTLDVLYPLVYGLFFALLLMRLWPRRRVWLLAGAVVLADLTENGLLAALYWTYPRELRLIPMASTVTTLKWILVAVVFVALVWGGLQRLASQT